VGGSRVWHTAASRSTWTRSATTWPGWSPDPWNRPTCPCGSAAVI